jgi:DNA invertase Pin-like site-specific DNA recombinase
MWCDPLILMGHYTQLEVVNMKSEILRAVGYRRVSMREQVDGFSLDAQENNIRQFIEAQGWMLTNIYTDAGISAKKDSQRPSLELLMKDAEVGRFDVVVVDKVDRFYRHLRGLLAALDQLNNWNIAFASVQERLDFTTVWGKLTLTVLGTLAEIYIDNLRQETRKGKLQRARDGYWNGNLPYGYCRGLCSNCKEPNGEGYCPDFGGANKSDGKLLVPHPIESMVVRLVYDWYLTGTESDGHIASRLNDYSLTESGLIARSRGIPGQKPPGPIQRDSIRNILTNVFYAGLIPYYGSPKNGQSTTRRIQEIFPGRHPALVTKEEYERVQEIRRVLYRVPRFKHPTKPRIYPLSGLLHCGFCGRTMRGSGGQHGTHYYRDATRIEKSGSCSQMPVRATAIEDQVAQWLRSELSNQTYREVHLKGNEALHKLKARYNRAKELFISGQLERSEYEVEKEKFEYSSKHLHKNENHAILTLLELMQCKLAAWQEISHFEKRKLLQLVAEAVFLTGSVLVGVQPTFALIPLINSSGSWRVSTSGPDGIRTRDLGLDRAAC